MMNIFVASATAPTMVYPHAYSPRRAGIACQLSSGMLKKSGLIAIKQYPSFKCAISRRKASGILTTAQLKTQVEFLVPDCPLEFGQHLIIVGSANALGSWNASDGLVLNWTEGDNWKASAEIDVDAIEFKLVKATGATGDDSFLWEDGDNRGVVVASEDGPAKVIAAWGGGTTVHSKDSTVQEKKLKSAAGAAKEKAERIKSKRKTLEEKVNGLEEKVIKSSKKMNTIKKDVDEKAGAVEIVVEIVDGVDDDVAAPKEETHEAPVHVAEPTPISTSTPGSSGVELSQDLVNLVKGVSVGTDGSMVIEFGADDGGVDAAELAKRLKL